MASKLQPLAVRLRPKSLEEFVGQEHILGKGKPLRGMIEYDKIRSLILFGPPGTGKTTLAEIIANITKSEFYSLNATNSGTKDIRALINKADIRAKKEGRRTIAFADEIHRWSKNVQDVLLPSVEKGTIILIGATTQNPYFSINGPILSRSQLFEFKHLTTHDLKKLLKRTIVHYMQEDNIELHMTKDAVNSLLERVGGDARKLMSVLEIIVETQDEKVIKVTENIILEVLPRKHVVFDRAGDEHFDGMSAIQNSIQASDVHGSIYWLAWSINRGEDLTIICRRMLVTAAEDVGISDPQCLPYVYAAVKSALIVGYPEANIILSSAVAYMAASPRSKASAIAIWDAVKIDKAASKEVPDPIKDSHYAGATKLGRGSHKDGQNPDSYNQVIDKLFIPVTGKEVELMKHNAKYWEKINRQRKSDELG